MNKLNKQHFVNVLLIIVLTSLIIYFGKPFFIIIFFSGLLAMLMTPVSNFLEKHKFSRTLSSIISGLTIVIAFSVFILVIAMQLKNISDQYDIIQQKITTISNNFFSWVNDNFDVNSGELMDSIKNQSSQAMKKMAVVVAVIAKGTFTFLGSFLLVIVFTFLFLLHREKYENFFVMLFPKEKQEEIRKVIGKIGGISQKYLGGIIISIFILFVLYLTGFLIVGLKNGFVLAAIASLLTFIPYVGPFVGGLLPVLMAFITGSPEQAFWIIVVLVVAQTFQNYFIEPSVVGGSVNISPFFTILSLVAGGMIWGVAGIVLFLPMLGILRIIFENVKGLEPYAYLIGNQNDSASGAKIVGYIKNLFSKLRK